ncbi:MAG: signal peptidase I [Oscillospiraceae bacterium]|nr:signal peptidase I [Oscillospiraceae bacterium]
MKIITEKHGPERKEFLKFLVFYALIPALAAYILFSSVIGLVCTRGRSMEPTLSDGAWAIILRICYTPKRGDIIVLKQPEDEKIIIKRVIAVGGDEVFVNPQGDVYVNSERIEEPYLINHEPVYKYTLEPVEVSDGCVWVLGDNRNNSTDSRVIGEIPISNILGKVIFTITKGVKR